MSSASSFAVRRTLRLSFSSSNVCRSRFCSSLASSLQSPLIRGSTARGPVNPPSLFPVRFASSKPKAINADNHLKRVLNSEIEAAREEEIKEVALPSGFPFEIIDNPSDRTITLKREFACETIEVTVFSNLDAEDDVENDEDDSEDEKKETSFEPSLSLVIKVDKGDGPYLEFCCNLSATLLKIESMSMRKPGDSDDHPGYEPQYSDLDESLQKVLHEYLGSRGIESSLFDSLQEYMNDKEDKGYLTWLQNMKSFIEK